MPIFNAAVTALQQIDAPPNTYFWSDRRMGYLQMRNGTLAMSAWPWTTPPEGTECALKLARYEADNSFTIGPSKVMRTTVGTQGQTIGRPFIQWLSDTRIATVRYEWAAQQQIAELWAVNTSTLALTLLDQTAIGPPADGGSWSMDNGSVSEAGVVCVCFNKFTSGQPQNVAGPDIYQFAVCEVVGDSFSAWTRRDQVRDGYHTKWRTYPISANRFLTPWTSASGGVYESCVYDAAADTLQLASREVSSWATAGGATPVGPGAVMDSTAMRMEYMEPDTFFFRYGLWRWNGSSLVNLVQSAPLEGYGVFNEIPEYTDELNFVFAMPDGTFGIDGTVYKDDLSWFQLGWTIRPDMEGDRLYVGAIPEGLDVLNLSVTGYLGPERFWSLAPYGGYTPYGQLGRALLVIEPQEPTEIADEFEGSAARFW